MHESEWVSPRLACEFVASPAVADERQTCDNSSPPVSRISIVIFTWDERAWFYAWRSWLVITPNAQRWSVAFYISIFVERRESLEKEKKEKRRHVSILYFFFFFHFILFYFRGSGIPGNRAYPQNGSLCGRSVCRFVPSFLRFAERWHRVGTGSFLIIISYVRRSGMD